MKKLLLMALGLIGATSYSQVQFPSTHSEISEQYSKLVPVPNSPEAEAFSQYGNVDVNLHTGQPNIVVPIYTYSGNEMDLPISLTYDASGIKVNQIATNVGLGWNLNVGGRISRQVRGLPDDYEQAGNVYSSMRNNSVRQTVYKWRDFYGYNYDEFLDATTAEDKVTELQGFLDFLDDVQNSEIDVEQDYYSLNVLGINETIWRDTQTYDPIVLENPNITVDLHPGATSTIGGKVVDGNGVMYFFGDYQDDRVNPDPYPFNFLNDSEPVERVKRISNNDVPGNMVFDITYQSSWLVNRIVSANGKDVYDFQYTTNSGYNNPEYYDMISGVKTHVYQKRSTATSGPPKFEEAGLPFSSTQNVSETQSKFQQQILTAIYHNGKEIIRFELADRRDIKDGVDKAIASISIYEDYQQNNTPVEKITFDHSYFGQQQSGADAHYFERLKLDQVRFGVNSNKNKYSFDYSNPSDVVSRKSFNQDYMGYYNGPSNNGTIYEAYIVGSAQYNLSGADRTVDANYIGTGTLNKITYPTGGYAEFEFENHTDGIEDYPGLRVKAITSYTDSNVQAFKKEYEYATSLGGASSLIENYVPFLNKLVDIQPNPVAQSPSCDPNGEYEVANPQILYRYAYPPNMNSHPYITYSDVFEKQIESGQQKGYTHYEFGNDVADGWHINGVVQPPYAKGHYTKTIDGKIVKKDVRDSNSTQLLMEDYTYTDDENLQVYHDKAVVFNKDLMEQYTYLTIYYNGNDINVTTSNLGMGNCSLTVNPTECQNLIGSGTGTCIFDFNRPFPSYEFKPIDVFGYAGGVSQVVKTEYRTGGNISTTTSTTYNNTNMLPESLEITTDDLNSHKTLYTYVTDLQSPTNAENELINQNKLTTLIQTKDYEVTPSGSILIGTNKTIYKEWNISGEEFVLPEKIQTSKGDAAVSSLEDRIVIDQLDIHGNILQASLKDGPPTSYIYSSDGQYLLAKLENASYGSIPSGLLSNIQSANDQAGLITACNILRSDSSMSDAMITSYSYIPLVGVSSVTDPRGTTVYYHYDEHNRLEYVEDQNGKVLSKNEYNYRNN